MRLWHKDLILVLPRQQLLGQWRECCAIAKNITTNGTPNHILVNKVMEYPMSHLYTYGLYVATAMRKRGYECDTKSSHIISHIHMKQIVLMEISCLKIGITKDIFANVITILRKNMIVVG